MDLASVGTDVERVIATEEELKARVAELAAAVDADYKGRDLLLVKVESVTDNKILWNIKANVLAINFNFGCFWLT